MIGAGIVADLVMRVARSDSYTRKSFLLYVSKLSFKGSVDI